MLLTVIVDPFIHHQPNPKAFMAHLRTVGQTWQLCEPAAAAAAAAPC